MVVPPEYRYRRLAISSPVPISSEPVPESVFFQLALADLKHAVVGNSSGPQ